ncbi:hypothetical protein VSDG_04995 [Cytospora chrysosperma]|uniref:Uncharacterized protein n=1 Tax=Cytospora chrysosperma TaxID=252740 RepID=A0A423VYV6_CYTCH|nr:hypothetical protein VSDG_04995 [Valsa sordida]
MAQQDEPGHGLLKTIIAEIAVMTDPLPGPTKEEIASIVLQAQVQYLQDKVVRLETESQGLHDQIADLQEENSILRFENDILFDKENRIHGVPQTSPPIAPQGICYDLINLGPDPSPSVAAEYNLDDTQSLNGKTSGLELEVEIVGETQNRATSRPKKESADQDKDHELGRWGCKNNPVVVEDDYESSSKHPFRPDESSIALQQRSLSTIRKDLLLVAEADHQNTSLFLTNLLPNTSYRALLLAISTIRPGRIKEAQIRDGNTAKITFFTRQAAEKLYEAFQNKDSRPHDPLLQVVSATWSKKHIPPEGTKNRTRILRVEGHPGFVNVANVLAAVRWQGFSPQMESIILTPPQSYPRPDSLWLSPLQQVICSFRSVSDAEMDISQRTLKDAPYGNGEVVFADKVKASPNCTL